MNFSNGDFKVTLKWLAMRVAGLGRVEMQRVLSWLTVRELAILLSFAEKSKITAITSNLTQVGRENLLAEMKTIRKLKINDGVYDAVGKKIADYIHLSLKGDSFKGGQKKSFVRPA